MIEARQGTYSTAKSRRRRENEDTTKQQQLQFLLIMSLEGSIKCQFGCDSLSLSLDSVFFLANLFLPATRRLSKVRRKAINPLVIERRGDSVEAATCV